MRMSTNTIKPADIRSGFGGRLFSSTASQSFKSIGASSNIRTFATTAKGLMMAAPESSMSMTAKQMQRQMTTSAAQVFKSSKNNFSTFASNKTDSLYKNLGQDMSQKVSLN